MYLINVRAHYDSAHGLRSYRGKPEPIHGHHWRVEVGLATRELGEGGIAFDFVEVEQYLQGLVRQIDHRNLNETEPFDRLEPSAENQARWFYDELKRRLPQALGTSLVYVRVWETPDQWAEYRDD
ncbi:MAG: 6-pyruvoyl trahydropterin synthase family protein [Longimicrobiales bacterium]